LINEKAVACERNGLFYGLDLEWPEGWPPVVPAKNSLLAPNL
jgi:hypothetical protein